MREWTSLQVSTVWLNFTLLASLLSIFILASLKLRMGSSKFKAGQVQC